MDHIILQQRLRTSFGLNGTILLRFQSYLDQRLQHVCHLGEQSAPSVVQFGVPQGPYWARYCLCCTRYYMADVVSIVQCQGLSVYRYADDIQVYSRCHPTDSTSFCRQFGDCIEQITSWMGTNCLQLNAAKTEFTWFVPPRHRHHFPSDHLVVGSVHVASADSARDLGVYLDSNMSMKPHINRLMCSCFGIIRQIRSIRRPVPRSTLATLISSFIMPKLDYCNVSLASLLC